MYSGYADKFPGLSDLPWQAVPRLSSCSLKLGQSSMNAFQALNRKTHLRCFAFAVILLFLLSIASWHKEVLWNACSATFNDPGALSALSAIPQKRMSVAFATTFVFHLDVLLPVAWTMERVTKGNGKMQVFAPAPLPYNFQHVLDELAVYPGAMKLDSKFLDELRADHEIDLVILGTCEFDMRQWSHALLAIWDARSAEHKFQLVCIVHHSEDIPWQSHITDWSRRNAFRVLAISDHVAKAFRRKFDDHATDPDPSIYSAGYEYILTDFHSPILNFTSLPEHSPTRTLTHAVIQGSYDIDRRDYDHIFEQLLQSLLEDPKRWGYLSPRDNNPAYIEDPNADQPPFKLHLAGSGGALDVPQALQNMVVFERDLLYPDFYEFLKGMDVCLPAFAKGIEYYEQQGSSTVATCSQLHVPLLVTPRMRRAYTYIDDDRATITRPVAMREMDALLALRTGSAAGFLASDPARTGFSMGSNAHVREAVEEMMRKGWVRSRAQFDSFKRDVWRYNDKVVMRILRDL